MFTKIFSAAAIGAFLLGGLSQPVKANGWSAHRELLTFSAPIALPGVTLAAGTYAFEIPSENASHSLVRVSSADGRRIYLTAFTREVRRPNVIRAPKVTFHETARNAPRPVNTWYPAGDDSGKQFIYN
jgi:hypothetical protein